MPDSLIPTALIAVWLLLCGTVAASLDFVATRPVVVAVEDFRRAGMTDEQVLSEATQAAFSEEANWWWVRSGPVRLVFEDARPYDIDPALVTSIRHSAPDLVIHLPASAH
ncbi:MAG: hypothetical protein AAF089_00985 [Bacteroidota bacterium]